MKISTHLTTALIFIFLGVLFFCYQQGVIIIRWPCSGHDTHLPTTSKKKVDLIYWQQDDWHREQETILWPDNKAMAVEYLMNSWLNAQESYKQKNITVQVILTPTGQEAYLSFSKNPLTNNDTIYENWMRIEGLLKTMHTAIPEISAVNFLVNHEPLTHYHLDFSNAWPTTGFTTE